MIALIKEEIKEGSRATPPDRVEGAGLLVEPVGQAAQVRGDSVRLRFNVSEVVQLRQQRPGQQGQNRNNQRDVHGCLLPLKGVGNVIETLKLLRMFPEYQTSLPESAAIVHLAANVEKRTLSGFFLRPRG